MSGLGDILPRRLDWKLLTFALPLTAIGIWMVSSTHPDLVGKQLAAMALGLLFAGLLFAVDYRILLQYSPGIYGATLLLLLYLPIFGRKIAGSKSWIKVGGGFSFQPSELGRLSLALLLAWILESDDRAFLRQRTIVALSIATFVPVVLILLQPDLGVTLTYLPFLAVALFFGGLKGKVWAALILGGILAAGGSWFFLKDYQKKRILTFLDPSLESRGAGYQVRQARIAIGSGGIVGQRFQKGTLKESQSRLGFLPARHTDFIFAALAEEFGFVGVAVVLSLYGLLVSRAFSLARDARDRGGSMLVLLLVINIAVQAIVNIAMNVGLIPTTGITLPFISYGGSSLIATWGMIGLILSVAYRRFVNI